MPITNNKLKKRDLYLNTMLLQKGLSKSLELLRPFKYADTDY